MIEPQHAPTDVNGDELTDEEQAWLEESTLEIEPFVKTNWKTAASRDRWAEVMSQGYYAKEEAEWRSVFDDRTDRKAAIIHVRHTNRDEWLEKLVGRDGAYRPIRYSKPYDGYSHEHKPTDKSDPERFTYAVIAENDDVADTMEEAELELSGPERHDVVGELLGFPDCCREFFNEHFLEESIRDPMYEAACNSDCAEAIDGDPEQIRLTDPSPWANTLWRYFSWSFLTHIPCSFDCERSEDIGYHRAMLMAENGYADYANALRVWLDLPFEWSGYHGLARVANEHLLGSSGTSDYWSKKRIVWRESHPSESVI